MGFAGSSIHVQDRDQEEIVRAIVKHIKKQGLVQGLDCLLGNLPKSEKKMFRLDMTQCVYPNWTQPHKERSTRAFLLSPRLGDWVSIFEWGEFYDLEMATCLSEDLSAYVVAVLWEEHVGAQIFYGYRMGK